jgi:shikimate dehydrogenase
VATRARYAVIGDPVEHSLSPRLFALLFDWLEIDASYEAIRVPRESLPAWLGRLRAGEFDGLSVTLPLKELVARHVDRLSPVAAQLSAVNCLCRARRAQDGELDLVGHNTDWQGIARTLERAGVMRQRMQVVLLGAGGAARAVIPALQPHEPNSLWVANRTVARAQALTQELGMGEAVPLDDGISSIVSRADLIINATSVGLRDASADPLPVRCQLSAEQAVLDLVYRPLRTALLQRAQASGCTVMDGLRVLVHQALAQAELWLGRSLPDALADRLHDALAQEAR